MEVDHVIYGHIKFTSTDRMEFERLVQILVHDPQVIKFLFWNLLKGKPELHVYLVDNMSSKQNNSYMKRESKWTPTLAHAWISDILSHPLWT